MTTLDRLRVILAEILGTQAEPTPIEPHARLSDDLGADSLDAYEMQLAIEEEFGVAIEDDELPSLITVGDLVKRINGAHPQPQSPLPSDGWGLRP